MKLRSFLFVSALAATCLSTVARADPFFTEIDGQLTSSNATQLGRPSRNGVPQTWAGQENYPGQINTTTGYFYTTYNVPLSQFQGPLYLDVSVNDVNATGDFFVSAYANSYNPANRSSNWLGDEGTTDLTFFNPPVPPGAPDFEFVLPVGDSLILMVNSTLANGGGLNQPYNIFINAYSDSNFDDPIPAAVAATPEPGSLMLTLTGLLGTVGVARRRFAARA